MGASNGDLVTITAPGLVGYSDQQVMRFYYADVTIMMADRTWIFDSRSSDAIALALLFKAPIVVAKPTWMLKVTVRPVTRPTTRRAPGSASSERCAMG